MERRNGRQGHHTGRGAYKQWSGDTKIFPVSPKIFVPGHEDGLHLAVLLGLEVALLAGDVLQQLPGLGPAGLHTTLGETRHCIMCCRKPQSGRILSSVNKIPL